MMAIFAAIIIGLFGVTQADSGSNDNDGDILKIPPLISFDKGRIGVNFLGFRASAGLGSILTGNAADGGLYAEAGTPFGQFAHAGLGGQVDSQGRSTGGGLFAGATAGNGVSAKAGLAGDTGSGGYGYAGASAGGLSHMTVKNLGAPVGEVVEVRKQVIGKNIDKNIQLIPVKEGIKKQDKIIEEQDGFGSDFNLDVRMQQSIPPVPRESIPLDFQQPILIEKTKIKGRRRPHLKRKQILVYRGGYAGIDSLPGPPIAPLPEANPGFVSQPFPEVGPVGVTKFKTVSIGKSIAPIPQPVPVPVPVPVDTSYGINGVKTVSVRKSINPEVINDIFNIPISTLKAVSQLVGGITKGVDGSVVVNKSVSVNAG